jgi:hypothetical protein
LLRRLFQFGAHFFRRFRIGVVQVIHGAAPAVTRRPILAGGKVNAISATAQRL